MSSFSKQYLMFKAKAVFWSLFIILMFVAIASPDVEISYIPENKVEQIAFVEHQHKHHPVADFIVSTNSKVDREDAAKLIKSSLKWGSEFGVEPTLLLAMAKVESTFDKHAISHAGAMGVLQIIPKWHIDKIKAARNAVGTPELFDIETNVYVGAQVIQQCRKKFKDLSIALKCYNGSVGMKTTYATDVLRVKSQLDKIGVSI